MPSTSDPVADLTEALWDVLRRLDPDLVPASLDKVVAHSGKRLTPPLAKRMFDEVESNDWLRERMAEQVDADGDPVTDAYLRRAPGFWRSLAGSPGDPDAMRRGLELSKRLSKMEQQHSEAKRRVKQLREENARLETELKAVRTQGPATTPVPPRAEAHSRIAQLEEQLAAANAEVGRLRDRIADLRRRQRDRPHPSGGGEGAEERGFGRVDPVEHARRLDLQAASSARRPAQPRRPGSDAAVAAASASAVDPVALRVPEGIAPDSPAAIDWLTELVVPVLVIVDGYNVTYLIDPVEFRTGAARRRLVVSLAGLRRRLPPAAALEVVFDSAEGADSEPVVTAAGVTVRFTKTGEIADDDIVATVTASSQSTVVVSNDRELRSRAEHAGATPLWGDALVRWMDA